KKIPIGSMLVFIMLLLIPSIPAIQINTIENEINQKNSGTIAENPSFGTEGFPEIPECFPLLFLFVIGIGYFRALRFLLWIEYSIEFDDYFPGQFEIIHPLGVLRAAMLLWTTEWWLLIWNGISNRLGWDWSFY
ncbi:MAG: hypothetical protein JSW60_02220, partial [Thermoplasmatales archaeon]